MIFKECCLNVGCHECMRVFAYNYHHIRTSQFDRFEECIEMRVKLLLYEYYTVVSCVKVRTLRLCVVFVV